MGSRAKGLLATAAVLLLACSGENDSGDPTTMSGDPPNRLDAGSGFMSSMTPPRSGECTRHAECEFPEACVGDRCTLARSCVDVAIDVPWLCLGWEDLADSSSGPLQAASIQVVVDGGVGALGDPTNFRCPEVSELRVNVGGEDTGYQPVCGPDASLLPRDDAGEPVDFMCCYGGFRVAGV